MRNASRPAWLRLGGTGIALALLLAPLSATQAAKSKPKRGPINATVTVDQARAAAATITRAAGGKVAVTAANGTRVTVSFPAGAVVEDTAVTAAPVTKLASRWTRSGLLAGVQLQPEGLVLLKPATVRFARRGRAPESTRLVFVGSGGTGRDLYRLPPPIRVRGQGKNRRLVLTGAPVVSIWHFSTVEGFDWSTATIAEIDAINRPALGNHRLDQQVSELFANGGKPTLSEILAVLDRGLEHFIRPLLSTAQSVTCSEAGIRRLETALRTGSNFERQVRLLGGDNGALLAEALPALMKKTATCMTELCPKLGDPRVGVYLLKIARQLALLGIGSNAFFAALFENILGCATFELRLDSRIDHVFEGANFSLRVSGTAKYEPALAAENPRPRAPLTYTATSGSSVDVCETTEISRTTNGQFELTDVTLSQYDPEHPSRDPVLSVKLTVTVQPMETYHPRSTPTDENCGTTPSGEHDLPLWFTGFQAEHPNFTFPGTDFARDAAPKFAIAVYGPKTIALQSGSVSENTVVELIHTPKPPVPLPSIDEPAEA